MITCQNSERYNIGNKIVVLVDNTPIITIGAVGTIVSRWIGPLYAAVLPNGQFYKWLAVQDLQPIDPSQPNLRIGDLAIVNTTRENSFSNPFVINGITVRIVKIIVTDYYGISVIGGNINNAWVTGSEISIIS